MLNIFAAGLQASIKKYFGHQPTEQQETVIEQLSDFVSQKADRKLFILKGYAGTGKTSLVSALTKSLRTENIPFVLMAPTGRAAKVLSAYSGFFAHTIHRRIYFARTGAAGNLILRLQKNQIQNGVFIVDEASMIPDDRKSDMEGGRILLDDLIEFVFSGKDCKLIFIGDTAQLPPVGLVLSPALEEKYLKNAYHLHIQSTELTQVVRQEKESGILNNATYLREILQEEIYAPPYFELYGYKDIKMLPASELQEELTASYDRYGQDETVVITRSNKRANMYNREIRNRILFREGELAAGDMLMIVKNNYYWLEKEKRSGFLANGDVIEVITVLGIEEIYGFRFANIRAILPDYAEESEIELKVILDTLFLDAPAFGFEDNNRLFQTIVAKYGDIPDRTLRLAKVKEDPYFNALQIKFAYTLTCHKTQGGQWHTVFLDQLFIKERMYDRDLIRWLYTAVTRAKKRLFLINYPEEFMR